MSLFGAELKTENPVGDGTKLMVYKTEDGRFRARPIEEFKDGRFRRAAELLKGVK